MHGPSYYCGETSRGSTPSTSQSSSGHSSRSGSARREYQSSGHITYVSNSQQPYVVQHGAGGKSHGAPSPDIRSASKYYNKRS